MSRLTRSTPTVDLQQAMDDILAQVEAQAPPVSPEATQTLVATAWRSQLTPWSERRVCVCASLFLLMSPDAPGVCVCVNHP